MGRNRSRSPVARRGGIKPKSDVEKRRRSHSRERDRDVRQRDRDLDRDREARREREKPRIRERHRSRSHSPPARHRRSRTPPPRRRRSHERSASPGSKHSSSKDSVKASKQVIDRPVVSEKDLEGKTEDEVEMLKLMGFATFDTTKGKHVSGNTTYVVNTIHKRKYRQYMNRKGGFNRPLDFVA